MSRTYLSIAEVLLVHQAALEHGGGSPGVRDRNSLESAVFRPPSGYYTNVIEEAAALIGSLAMNHPFVDANKRTAYLAADTFLRMNGNWIDVDEGEGEQFFLDNIKQGTFRFLNICDWLRKVTKPLPE